MQDLNPANQVLCAAKADYSHVGIRLVLAAPTETQYDKIGDTPMIRKVETNPISIEACNAQLAIAMSPLDRARRCSADMAAVLNADGEHWVGNFFSDGICKNQ